MCYIDSTIYLMQHRMFTLSQKQVLGKNWPQVLRAGWRWAWLRLHSPGINLPLPAVITAKRPTGTTPRTRLNSVSLLYALPFTANDFLSFQKIYTLKFAREDPTRVAVKRYRISKKTAMNKGGGRRESRRMQTTGSPLCEPCWG